MSITRRHILQAGAASTSLCFAPYVHAQARTNVRYATLNAGISVIFDEYLKAKRFDHKHGLNIELATAYTSVPSYYSDFIAGSFDLAIGAWDSFKGMSDKGVPVKLASIFTTADIINIVAGKNGPQSATELKGRPLAAVVATGSYNMCRAVLKNAYGVELGKDMPVQNVPNPVQAVAMVVSGNVDAALSWEPNIISAFEKVPDLKAIFNLGREYESKQKRPLPYFGLAVRKEAIARDADLAKRVDATCRDLVAAINADPSEIYGIAAPKLGLKVADMIKAHEAGRLKFLNLSMLNEDGREAIRAAQAYIDEKNPKINPDFFPS